MTISKTLRIRSLSISATALAVLGVFALTNEAPATEPGVSLYRVTVTNVTRGQIFSPAFVMSHDSGASLFALGQSASPGLALMAEDGDASGLVAMMSANPAVTDVIVDGGALMPGQTTTVMVLARSKDTISVAGMLVSTNDAFYAVRALPTPSHREATHGARAYDAGSEANSEDCAFIPGPPCGNGGVHDPSPAEGYVHVHAGIHGIGSLDAAQFDWRSLVAEVRIERM